MHPIDALVTEMHEADTLRRSVELWRQLATQSIHELSAALRREAALRKALRLERGYRGGDETGEER